MNRKTVTAGIIGVAVLVVAASTWGCGSDSKAKPSAVTEIAPTTASTASATETEPETTVPVSLSEWKITSPGGGALGPLKAGEIKFEVRNDGKVQHEFIVVSSDADPGSFAVKDDFKIDEEAAGKSAGEADDIEPGQVKTATMRLSAGTYVFLCNLPSHYKQGMFGKLVVQ